MKYMIGDGPVRRLNDSGNILSISLCGKFISIHFIVTTTKLYYISVLVMLPAW